MTNTIYRNIIITLLLVLMQVFVFNNIHFLGKGTPMIYIYAILSFPKSTPRILQLFIAFFFRPHDRPI